MNTNSKTRQALLIIITLMILGSVTTQSTKISLAQTATGQPSTYTLLEPLPCIQGQGAEGVTCKEGEMVKTVNFKDYVLYAVNLLIALAAVSAVFMIVWGGFLYMTTDSWQGKNDGKKYIMNAIYGLLLILTSFLILKTIDPRLVEIPSTLVPQLSFNCDPANGGSANNIGCGSRNNINQFMDDLSADAVRYGAESDALKAARKESQRKIQENLDAIAKIDTDIKNNKPDQTSLDELRLNQEALVETNRAERSAVVSQTYASTLKMISGRIETMNPQQPDGLVDLVRNGNTYKANNSEAISVLQTQIIEAYETGVNKLKEISNPMNPEALTQLSAAYKEANLLLDKKKTAFRIK